MKAMVGYGKMNCMDYSGLYGSMSELPRIEDCVWKDIDGNSILDTDGKQIRLRSRKEN